MIISEIVKELERIKKDFGDLPCLIEVEMDYVSTNMPVDECAVEERDGYGLSVKFIM
jgi:hypothetical protein